MDFNEIKKELTKFLCTCESNCVSPDDAMRIDLIGMKMYDEPLFGIAEAQDPLFAFFKSPEIIGPDYMVPEEWLPGAKSVVSFFLPICERARTANAADFKHISDEWLHCRIEGQMMVNLFAKRLSGMLEAAGGKTLIPPSDPRFSVNQKRFRSNWSERHAAYVCGLGTFGMSRGLITKKGVAGRFGSVITDLELPSDRRNYTGPYDYCIKCGLCADHCPVRAIDPSRGLDDAKSNPVCGAFLDAMLNDPPRGKSGRVRYGCGKCQVGVPCENQIPGAAR